MLYPQEEYGSTYQIPYEDLYKTGFRGIIFDIDNTLVPHGAPADDRARKLCKNLTKIGFRICLVSNNWERRVKPFAEELGVYYISSAGKPGKKGYLQASKLMEVSGEHILVIGDQILTDIWGANRLGFYSILVAPINQKEEIQIVLKRFLERVILFFFRKSKHYKGNHPDRNMYEENIPKEYR